MRLRAVVLWAAVLSIATTTAQGQAPGINLNLFPRIGIYKPLGELAEVAGRSVELKGGTGVGLSAELVLPLFPLNLRANLDYALGSGTKTDDFETEGDNTVLALTADLILRLAPAISPLQPYLVVGGGIRQYDFDLGSFTSTVRPAFEEKASDLAGHIGAGLAFKLGPLALVGEVNDYISSFKPNATADGKLQNDLFMMVGFRIGMF